jgi:hypothetical protein
MCTGVTVLDAIHRGNICSRAVVIGHSLTDGLEGKYQQLSMPSEWPLPGHPSSTTCETVATQVGRNRKTTFAEYLQDVPSWRIAANNIVVLVQEFLILNLCRQLIRKST